MALSLSAGIKQYLTDLTVKNYSELTVYSYQLKLKLFTHWCDERSLSLAAEITEEIGRASCRERV